MHVQIYFVHIEHIKNLQAMKDITSFFCSSDQVLSLGHDSSLIMPNVTCITQSPSLVAKTGCPNSAKIVLICYLRFSSLVINPKRENSFLKQVFSYIYQKSDAFCRYLN